MPYTQYRERTVPGRTVVVTFEKLYALHPEDPDQDTMLFYSPPYQVLYEKYTPNSDLHYKAWKSFQHYKRWSTYKAGSLGFVHGYPLRGNFDRPYRGTNMEPLLLYDWSPQNPSRGFGEAAYPVEGLQAYIVEEPDGSFVPPPTSLSDLKERSLKTLLPEIKSELSLLNSIIELKDFASLPRTISGLRQFATTFQTLTNRGRTLRQMLRVGSDLYLQWKFNIATLLSDICSLRTALSRYEKRLNDLVARQGRPMSRHFVWIWNEYVDSSSKKSGYILNDGQFVDHPVQAALECLRQTRHSPSVFHAQLQYNYNYTQYQLEHARVLALLDALGLNLNPAIIWNAIPWSFVVDWVFGVSRWLNTLRTSNMKPVINIHRYLWSIKRARSIELTVHQYSNPWNALVGSIGSCPMPVIFETAYRRQVEMPSSSSIQSSGLNLNEFSLGAALILSRKRRRH